MVVARAGTSPSSLWLRAGRALGSGVLAAATALVPNVAVAAAQTERAASPRTAKVAANAERKGDPSRVATAAERQRTALGSTLSRRVMPFDGGVTVAGRLMRAGSQDPMAGRRVQLLARAAGNERFWVVGQQRTTSDGAVQWRVTPRRHTVYRLRHRRTPTTTASTTTARSVAVRPRLRAAVARGSMPVGDATRVRGKLRPARRGARVFLQRHGAGGWQTTATQRLSRRSRFDFRVEPARSVRARYRVVRPADRGHLRAIRRAGRVHVYRVKIARVRFNPPGADDRHLNRERVTVVNSGRVGVRLGGWRLHASRSERSRALPAYRLRPGGRVRLHSGRGATERGSVHLRSAQPLWANHYGSRARLADRNRALASRFAYDAPPPLRGMASWYGPGFEGNTTACGNRFDPADFTLASRELPCGTPVRVVGPRGGVNAVVDDYGPASWTGRRFDLSRATFAAVQDINAGTAHVRVHRR